VRECNQILEVSAPVEFIDVEVGIYQLQMQSYTANFGEMLGIPFVVTTCTVTEQNLAGGRRVVQLEGSSGHGLQGDDSAREGRLGRKLEKLEGLGRGVRKTTQNEAKRSHLQLAKWLRHHPATDLQTDILEHMFPSSPSSRTLQTATPRTLLVMQFNIQYESRYGVVVDNYPSLFQEYINSNLEQVTLDMQTKFLPVVSAREVIVYNTKQPTLAPSPGGSGGSILPTPVVPPPTPQGGSPLPTIHPSGSPIDFNATAAPSASPTLSPLNVISTPPPTPPKEIIEDNTSFVVGLAAGLSGAALLVILFICYKRRENRRKQEAIAIGLANNEEMRRRQAFDAPRIMEEDGVEITAEEAMIVGQAEENGNGASESYGDVSHRQSSDGAMNNSGDGSTDLVQSIQQQQQNGQQHQQGTIADSIYSNPSMVSGGGSFSSKEGDNYAEGDVLLDPLQDEFDNYKNQDLEFMRNGVEESVYGAEGMMSWAMTRALMEDDDEGIDLKWGGAQDPESIEANCLCETYDWLRKNDHSTLDERNQFFQDILSRMIVTVRKNLMKPNEGTRTIHCCASLLGLRLEKDLPNNVLIVTGMRKTNNLSEGRYYLMEAFKPFGTIEGAAIAPSNRGFGFVRFAHHKSVERALESFRVSEIEVQDVSVMIKALKSESPGV